ncbi:sodium-translocating pyrophosphatase [Brevifollis gellanilyticus]|uniref:K(+)-insensitive pyrophosphate-energized proton pump n=1 Tax=Brevifollis gellanilyticus TaxID=748831 RepID=A0A512M3F9_9BACT|nr:sodium-translocating pyrophosphatase [Brevifollis gellanilyticus]GEP41276.1 K(+)-insensitive pyrophosphate-energized proton pump [Brevifollis gellanilyticus]
MNLSFLLTQGIPTSLALAVVGLAFAILLIRNVMGASAGNEKMAEIGGAIQQGAKAYLNRQIRAVSLIAVVIFVAVYFIRGGLASAGFVVGAVCSLVAGYIGMMVAVRANVRTAWAARIGAHPALKIAFNGGAVTGLLVVALGLLSVGLFFLVVEKMYSTKASIDALIGLALGSSLISVFARLGGGIYTKAADVGADLVGKIEQNLNEDDPRNPATIADNVGDNVGDCAGMAADVFETYAVSLIGALFVGHLTAPEGNHAVLVYPFVLCGLSIIASLLGIGWVNFVKQKATPALVGGVAVSGIVAAILFKFATSAIFTAPVTMAGIAVTPSALFYCTLIGLALTFAVVWITNYFTSTAHNPVRRIAKASETGHATNIIAGISVGHHATLLPVLCIAASIWTCWDLAGLYGIAIAVVSMLSLSGIIISLDAFGPITDNAGGIAVMSGLPEDVRKITDELDAVGNTMKAVTKGYAIASAGLAAMVLFGSYVEELKSFLKLDEVVFDLMNPKVIIGMFIGGLLPYLFTAFGMDAVGSAAGAVVLEVRRQIALKPGILNGTEKPEYGQCVDIVTKAALQQMIVPALLPIVFVVGVAFLGKEALGGLLIGTIVTGLFVGIAMTSAGGAWDNAKKYVEEGNHGGKGSFAHAAAVTGDTVGDPYKDTSGPAVNPMIKVVNVLAILVIPLFFK